MASAMLTVKRVRCGIHHVTFAEDGPESNHLRWVIRGELPVGTTEIDRLIGVLKYLPLGSNVFMACERQWLANKNTIELKTAGRFHPDIAGVVLEVARGISTQCDNASPDKARDLAKRFVKAAYQVFNRNGDPLATLAESLGIVPPAENESSSSQECLGSPADRMLSHFRLSWKSL